MRKLSQLLIGLSILLGLTGCSRALPDFSKADRVDIAYYNFVSSKAVGGKRIAKYNHFAQITMEQEDAAILLETIATLKPGQESGCAWGSMEIIIYLDGKVHSFFPAEDGCATYGYSSPRGRPFYESTSQQEDEILTAWGVFKKHAPEGYNGTFY